MPRQTKSETREQYQERLHRYYENHREQRAAYRATHKGQATVWRASRREERAAYDRRYRQSRGTELLASKRARREAHIDESRRSCRENYAAHRDERIAYTRSKEPMIARAIDAVRRAIKAGHLTAPTACQQCGSESPPAFDGRRTIQAHHFLGYSPEHWLDVRWLCIPCHRKADNRTAERNEAAA